MSQIAFGFLPERAAVAEAARRAQSGARDGGFSALMPYEFGTFDGSGYVLAVLDAWLDENGVELPRSDPDEAPGFVEAWQPMLSASPEEAAAALAKLEEIRPSNAELAAFWEEFNEEAAPDAIDFMAAGWNWLERLLRAGADAEWCVLVLS